MKRNVNKNRKENQLYLDGFEKHLKAKGLTNKVINKHIRNVDFYINEYLNYYEPYDYKTGLYSLDDFLGYWLNRKTTWANKTSIKENAASIKKFYAFMKESGLVDAKDYQLLCDEIKEMMPEWLDNIEDEEYCFY